METLKCLGKKRDTLGRITDYYLVNEKGVKGVVPSDKLKTDIKAKKYNVVNLKLTKDNRLIDVVEKVENVSDLVNAITQLELAFTDLSYTPYELAYDMCSACNLSTTDDYMTDIGKAIDTMLNDEKEFENLVTRIENITMFDESAKEQLKSAIQYENVSNINKSTIYNSLKVIVDGFTARGVSKKTIKGIKEFMKELKEIAIASIYIGYNVGIRYYSYLDSKLWGTISNDVYTVGHSISSFERKECATLKPYSYMCHSDINEMGAPEISVGALFKDAEDGYVDIDFKLARHGYVGKSVVSIRGYILDLGTLKVHRNESLDSISQQVAERFNLYGSKFYDLANTTPSLYKMLPIDAELEQLPSETKSLNAIDLVDLFINQITQSKLHEDCKVLKTKGDGIKELKRLYANEVGNDTVTGRLFVDYSNNNLTIGVIRDNKILKQESAYLEQPLCESARTIAKLSCSVQISIQFLKG